MINSAIINNRFTFLEHLFSEGELDLEIKIKMDESESVINLTLDSMNRIVKIEEYDVSYIVEYQDSIIIKRYKDRLPNFYIDDCKYFITKYKLNKKGYIVSSTTTCDMKNVNNGKDTIQLEYNYIENEDVEVVTCKIVKPTLEAVENIYIINNDENISVSMYNSRTNHIRQIYAIDNHSFIVNLINPFSREKLNFSLYKSSENNLEKSYLEFTLSSLINNLEGKMLINIKK